MMPKDQPFAVNVSSSDLAFSGMIWNVRREAFDFGEQNLTREFVEHPGAVAVVAINESNQVLMIRQYRHPVGEFLWEIPAGLLDVAGESHEFAARRELLEETGYLAQSLEPLIRPPAEAARRSVFSWHETWCSAKIDLRFTVKK